MIIIDALFWLKLVSFIAVVLICSYLAFTFGCVQSSKEAEEEISQFITGVMTGQIKLVNSNTGEIITPPQDDEEDEEDQDEY